MVQATNESSTRNDILLLLKTHGPMTVNDISQRLGITPMGIRQHLNRMEGQGLVKVAQQRGGVGRPGFIYSLTEDADEMFPRNYEALARFLLETVLELDGREKVETLFHHRAEVFKERAGKRLNGKGLKEKVETLAEIQDEFGYIAQVEEENGELHLTQYNCAIARVAREFPQACEHELRSYRDLLPGATVERISCAAHGDRFCRYAIRLESR